MSFINRNLSSKNKNTILPLHISLVRPYLEYAVQFWSPNLAKDIAKLEPIQHRAMKMILSLCSKFDEERLARQNMFSFEKCRLQGNSKVFENIKRYINVDANKLFSNEGLITNWE